jgi:hypothetical protein
MRAGRAVKSWSRAWGLMLFSIGIFHLFPAQAQQDTLTDQADQGDATQDHHHKHHHYQLIVLGTFGGPNSSNAWAGIGNTTTNSGGTLIGEADTAASDPYCLVEARAPVKFAPAEIMTRNRSALTRRSQRFGVLPQK